MRFFHAPPVIGELGAGVFLGPSLFGWVEPAETIRLMAEIGIILLLFGVGLESDVRRLLRTGVRSNGAVLRALGTPLGHGVGHPEAGWTGLAAAPGASC